MANNKKEDSWFCDNIYYGFLEPQEPEDLIVHSQPTNELRPQSAMSATPPHPPVQATFPDFPPDEQQPPAVKRPRLETRSKSSKEFESYTGKKHPKSTTYATNWALRNVSEWVEQRNSLFLENPVPKDLLNKDFCSRAK